MELKYIPVLLLTGYLGSGKTTLLNRILSNKRGIRFAVIVNDIGEVNIDASLIQKEGIVGGENADDLVALQNGCICCTLKMDLIKQLTDLARARKFDYIVIEASGICEPAPIAQSICSIPAMLGENPTYPVPRLDCIVTMVDALRMKSEFGCGDNLRAKEIGEEDIERLIIEQIEFCNIVAINKIDEVTPDEAGHLRAIVRTLQPDAEILECNYGDIPLDDILNTRLFDFEKVATSARWVKEIEDIHDEDDDDEHHHEHEHHHHHHHHHHDEGEAEEYGIGTFVYFRRQPLNFERFDDFVARSWPKNVIRTKGVMYFSHNPDMSLLFEQAGVQRTVREAGYWLATAPADDLAMMMARDPQLRHDWDPVYGDRMIKLVFIGRDLDREAISAELDKCLDNFKQ